MILFLSSVNYYDGQLFVFSVYGDFLINGPNCKIPNMNPFDKEVMKIFDREEFEACSKKQPLTTIEMGKDGKAKLIFHDDRKKDFLNWWQDNMEVKSLSCDLMLN